MSRPPASVTSGAGQGAAQRARAAAARHSPASASYERLELAEPHRPLVADVRDGAAEQAQRHLGRQPENFSASSRIGPPSVQAAADTAPAATPTASSIAASARRSRRASSASRLASSPSPASTGISARSRARVKRGSRFDGSSQNGDAGRPRSVAISRAFGRSSSGRTSKSGAVPVRRARRAEPDDPRSMSSGSRAMAASPVMPLPRAMRNSTVSA